MQQSHLHEVACTELCDVECGVLLTAATYVLFVVVVVLVMKGSIPISTPATIANIPSIYCSPKSSGRTGPQGLDDEEKCQCQETHISHFHSVHLYLTPVRASLSTGQTL